jgi:hypothetical protein
MFDLIVPATELQNLPVIKRTSARSSTYGPKIRISSRASLPSARRKEKNSVERVLRTSRERYGRERLRVEKRLARSLAA